MGGILSGLLGGITKGAIGGYTAEGERKRKEEDLGKNILTQMHMQRLNDWENLSPEEQNFHMGEIARIHKIKPEVLGTGIQLAHSLATQLPAAGVAPPTSRSEPIGGAQKPVDIPLNTQDLSPAPSLPAPSLAPNAAFAPVPTVEALAAKVGINPKNMSINQRKALQAEVLKQSDVEQARQAKNWEEEQGIQTNVNAMRGKIPDSELTNFETALRSKTYYQGQHQGTMSAPTAYENSKGQQFLIGHNGKTNKFFDAESGQMMDTLPPDLKPAARPRNFAPRYFTDQNGNITRVDTSTPLAEQAQGKGVSPVPGAKGKIQFPPIAKVQDFDAQGNPIERVLSTPEARAESKQEGGFLKYPTLDINLSNHARRMLATSASLKTKIQEMQQLIGPFAGRVTQAEIKAGRIPGVDPATGQAIAQKARDLDASMQSFAALNPKLHGFRSIKSFDEFMAAGPHWAEDPEMALGALNGLDDTIKNFVIKGKPKAGGIAPPPTAAAPAPTSTKKKFKYNLQTGQLE